MSQFNYSPTESTNQLNNNGYAALLDELERMARSDGHLAECIRQATARVLGAGAQPEEDPGLRPIKTRWTLQELINTEFPEPKWAVPGLIPVGLNFLAGRPKLGKSWLALQVAHAVATGGKVFGTDVERGRVLYLALEDSPRRLKERCSKQGIPHDANITFLTNYEPLSEGGLFELTSEIGRNLYRLVIIDTLSRSIGKSDQLDPAEMTVVIGNLQRLSQNGDLSMLLIDHHRKTNGFESSPIDDILGSTAKAAVADGVLGLYREQGKHEATLKLTGRDVEERELALEWDGQLFCWQSLGEASEVRADTLKSEVIRAIQALADDGELPTTTRIAKYLGAKAPNVSQALADLMFTGRVKKGARQGREVPYELA